MARKAIIRVRDRVYIRGGEAKLEEEKGGGAEGDACHPWLGRQRRENQMKACGNIGLAGGDIR